MNFKFFAVILMTVGCFACHSDDHHPVIKQTVTETTPAMMKSGYVDVAGLKVYYELYGQGEPLVLIHGGGSTIQTTFGRVIPALSKSWKVIGIELQGHGHTADIDRPESFDQDAEDVVGVLNYLKIDKANFFWI